MKCILSISNMRSTMQMLVHYSLCVFKELLVGVQDVLAENPYWPLPITIQA